MFCGKRLRALSTPQSHAQANQIFLIDLRHTNIHPLRLSVVLIRHYLFFILILIHYRLLCGRQPDAPLTSPSLPYLPERRPVSEAYTQLSLKNYEKSATSARLLGVDPSLAKLLVQAAGSGPAAALVPAAVRRAGVQAALRTGLSTLSALRHAGNPFGDVRVALLQRQVLWLEVCHHLV